jgi:hypothetical protein
MNSDSDSFLVHCQSILKCPAIREKMVVLCEGTIQSYESGRSPQTYKKQARIPDANFYNACVPKSWTQYRPNFFTCGGRSSVLKTYSELIKLHEENPLNSYLNPDKLFAIVDCDFTPQEIVDYQYSTIDEIYNSLYKGLQVNSHNLRKHRIFVTGFVHKENYFLIPELQETFDEFSQRPHYQSPSAALDLLDLQGLYLKMAAELDQDSDLMNHWDRVHPRISSHFPCDYTTPKQFSLQWEKTIQKCQDTQAKSELIHTLLAIRKAKHYWEQCIVPPPDYPRDIQTYRDNLILKIGQFYSENSNNPRYHIPFLLKSLHERLI